MSDLIALACPSCGAKLEITQDIDRFACSHCGQQHIVKRAGGIVSLAPVMETLGQVKTGVDRTAAELAISRLEKEIVTLELMKKDVIEANPKPYESIWPWIALAFGVLMIAVGLSQASSTVEKAGLGGLLVMILIAGIVPAGLGGLVIFYLRPRKMSIWKSSLAEKTKDFEVQINEKMAQLKKNKSLVSL